MEIRYKSTRNSDVTVTASEAILKGLAEDGGLFVPEQIPALDKTMEEYRQLINNSNKFSDFKSKSLVDAAIEFLPDWTDWYKRVYMID